MAAGTCPGCGAEVVAQPGRGRPRRWCSDQCRKAGAARRRRRLAAAASMEETAAELRSGAWWFSGTDPEGLAEEYDAEAERLRQSC